MIIDKIYVSNSRPSTTNILWVKPLANGEFALYAFLKGRWSLLRIMKSGGTSSPDDDTPEEEGEGYTKEETDTLFLRKRVAQGEQYAERGLVTSMVNTIDGVGVLSTNAYAGGIIIGNDTNMLTLSPDGVIKSVAYGFPVSVVWEDTLAEQLAGKQDTINDLATIRSGAQAGATAYQKPQTGIPATDLASSVQTDLVAIGDIEVVIPEQASSSNQLADKNFVNSSIATATATYRGAFNLVTDLSLTILATHTDIATALVTVIQTADNNDYCFVQIPVADATPTEISSVERYKYNGTAWAYEYTLNNSGYTAAQWAAINSGITSGLAAKLSALPTNSELTTLLNGKANIADLAAVATSGSYNDLLDKPTIQDIATVKHVYALDATNSDYPSMRGAYVKLHKTCAFGAISIVNVTPEGEEDSFTDVTAQSYSEATFTIDNTTYTSYRYNNTYFMGLRVPFFVANVAQYGHDKTLGVLKFTTTQKGVFKVHAEGVTPSNCIITVNGVTTASLRQDLVAVQVNAGDVVKVIPTSTTADYYVRIIGFVLEGNCGVSVFDNDAGYLTQHQDISGKEDITPIEAVASGTTAITAQVNTYYEVAGTVSSLTITLPTPTTNTEVTMVVVHLTVGASPTVIITSSATVAYSAAHSVVANKEYEISCLYNGSKWIVSSMEVAV